MSIATQFIPSPHGKIAVFTNPKSGTYERHRELLEQLTRDPRIVLVKAGSRAESIATATRLLDNEIEMLVAAGGDGTVNTLVQALAVSPRRVPMAILPMGTGNDVCRNLGYCLEPDSLANYFLSGEGAAVTTPIDLLRTVIDDEDTFAINMVSVGNSPRWIESASAEEKQHLGPFSYAKQCIQMALDTRVFIISADIDDQTLPEFECLNFVVANGRAGGGGFVVAPNAEVNDGQAEVVIFGGTNLGDWAAIAAEFASMQMQNWGEMEPSIIRHHKARHIQLRSAEPLPISIDGDVSHSHHVEISVVPSAIEVVGILDSDRRPDGF